MLIDTSINLQQCLVASVTVHMGWHSCIHLWDTCALQEPGLRMAAQALIGYWNVVHSVMAQGSCFALQLLASVKRLNFCLCIMSPDGTSMTVLVGDPLASQDGYSVSSCTC